MVSRQFPASFNALRRSLENRAKRLEGGLKRPPGKLVRDEGHLKKMGVEWSRSSYSIFVAYHTPHFFPRQLVPIVAVLKQLEAWSGRAERHQALDQFSRRDLKWAPFPC